MKTKLLSKVAIVACFVGILSLALYAWTEKPIVDDILVFMPGSQPGSASLESANRCDNCHGGYNVGVEPAHNWRGSMMANAARDPLWMACLTVSLQDSVWALGNTNAGDLCIRCHTPTGWLGGRSDPPTTEALSGSDFEGVSCDYCHTAIDPFAELGQPELGAETEAPTEAEITRSRDLDVLSTVRLFDGSSFLDPDTLLPAHFGDGSLDNYIEATSGHYFVDPAGAKRGPRSDPKARHQWNYSRFHKTKYMCATCHDVSNPVLARLPQLGGEKDRPERQAAASFMHVERTFSEFMLSAYGRDVGAAVADKVGVGWASKCQDCHMRDVTGKSCNKKGVQVRDDLALHDLTGGNVWMSKILASADQTHPDYDPVNYNILAGITYSGAKVDVAGIQGYGQAILDGAERARQQLEMAARLEVVDDGTSQIILRIYNNTGHKLLSGFPEGRRMWLNVKFYSGDAVVGEINPYDETTGILTVTDGNLVYEAKMSSLGLTEEAKTFHFVLATERYKDNRIPPKGFGIDANGDFSVDAVAARLALPRWGGAVASDYFTAQEYAGGYDEVILDKPTGTASWEAELYYQTTSKEYIEFLTNEINGYDSEIYPNLSDGEPTLTGTGAGGDPPYLAQTDPYFASLKDWGKAIYDLWVQNEKCPPIVMASYGDDLSGGGCDPPASFPQNLTATAGRKDITLSWSLVDAVDGYNVYYSQGGKYTFIASTGDTSYKDTGLIQGQEYTYAVTAYVSCGDDNPDLESAYSGNASATTLNRKGGKK